MRAPLLLALWIAPMAVAWVLVVYRLKLLMKAAGIALLFLALLMHIIPDRFGAGLARLAIRIAQWIGREIEEHG